MNAPYTPAAQELSALALYARQQCQTDDGDYCHKRLRKASSDLHKKHDFRHACLRENTKYMTPITGFAR
jgi:hypothetical protein